MPDRGPARPTRGRMGHHHGRPVRPGEQVSNRPGRHQEGGLRGRREHHLRRAPRLADPRYRRVRRRPLPSPGGGAVETGFNPRPISLACGGVVGHRSDPGNSKISRSGSAAGQIGGSPTDRHRALARLMYSARASSTSGSASISNSVFFFSRERRIASMSGMCAMRLKPTLSQNRSTSLVSRGRVATQPARRT